MIVGVLVGFAAHQSRCLLERKTPHVPGLFPLACYVVGGLAVVGVYGILHGPRRAWELFRVFAAVGLGVGAGWAYDRVDVAR